MSNSKQISQEIKFSGPQTYFPNKSRNIIWLKSIALLPLVLWACIVHGILAVFPVLFALFGGLLTEFLINRIQKRNTLSDGNAFYISLFLGLLFEPSTGILIPFFAGIMAILFFKWAFGGMGSIWIHPALSARLIVGFAWPGDFQNLISFYSPSGIYSGSERMPLELLSHAHQYDTLHLGGPLSSIKGLGFTPSDVDLSLSRRLNEGLLNSFDINLPNSYVDLFLGIQSGSMAGLSALLILLIAVVLFAHRIITWQIPLVSLLSFSTLIWIFDGLNYQQGFFSGDILFHLLSGGILFHVFFSATESLTRPINSGGQFIYAILLGILLACCRLFFVLLNTEWVIILLLSFLVPVINKMSQDRVFGSKKSVVWN